MNNLRDKSKKTDSTPPQQPVEDELQNQQSQNTETHTSETSSQNVSSTKTQYFRIGDDFQLKEFGTVFPIKENVMVKESVQISAVLPNPGDIYMLVQIRGKKELGFRRYHPCRSAVSKIQR